MLTRFIATRLVSQKLTKSLLISNPKTLLHIVRRPYASTRKRKTDVEQNENNCTQDSLIDLQKVVEEVDNLWSQEKLKEAIELLENQISMIPRAHQLPIDRSAFILLSEKLAAAYEYEGRKVDAENVLMHLLSIDNLDKKVHVKVALSLADLSESENVERILNDELKNGHDQEIMSMIYWRLGNLHIKRSSIVKGPGPNLTRELKLAEFEKAIDYLNRSLDPLPDTDEELRKKFYKAYYCRAIAYQGYADINVEASDQEKEEYYTKAKENFDSTLSLNPDMHLAYLGRADVSIRLRDHAGAIVDYDTFDKNFEDFCKTVEGRQVSREELYLQVIVKKSVAYIHLEDNEMAIDQLQRFINLDDNAIPDKQKMKRLKAIAHHKQGTCFMLIRNFYLCIEANTKAIALDPSLIFAYRDRAIAYDSLNLFKEAAEDKKILEYLTRKMVIERTQQAV